jgi:putative endopeptidase
MYTGKLLAIAFTVIIISSCEQKQQQTNTYKGVDKSSMDTTVSPCEDFYLFANGTWIKNNPVPETENRWGAFYELRDQNNKILREILEKAMNDTGAAKGSNTQKIGDFYYCAMDSVKLDADKYAPLVPELEMIENIKDKSELSKIIARHHSYGSSPFFGLYVTQDLKQSDKYITYLVQSGLGLPDRDYYTNTDERFSKIRDLYGDHIDKIFFLAGKPVEKNKSYGKTVLKIENALANASMTAVERRDEEKQYNKMSTDSLKLLSPTFNWADYMSETGINISELIVSQPLFIQEFDKQVKSTSIEDIKVYLTWHLLHSAASKLSSDFEQENFNFYSTVLRGTKKMKPRWERALYYTNNALGEILGQEYVKVAFSQESKDRLNHLVDNLMSVFEERINKYDWMSEETKKQAQIKLKSVTRKIGYPDEWKDYSPLEISRESYVMNYFRANQFELKRNLDHLGKPIDKKEWFMSPQTVNAYYNPSMNEIVFPAGILHPPFFNPEADDAVNYGSICAVIGHELTHGFDDQGNRFDADGNMKNWWNEKDYEQFDKKAKMIIEQFNEYEAMEGLFVNGELTQGENIADLGGVSMAYAALKHSMQGKEPLIIDGFTPEQRLFIAYAQVWKNNERPESLRQMVMTNPHSPGEFRVKGPLSNLPEFFEAFGCKQGDKMVREESKQILIW